MQSVKQLIICLGRIKVNPHMVTAMWNNFVELVGSTCCWLLQSVCLSVPGTELSSALHCFTISWLPLGVTCTIYFLFVEDGQFNGVEVCAFISDSAGISVAGKSPADRTWASPEHSELRATSASTLLCNVFLDSVRVFSFCMLKYLSMRLEKLYYGDFSICF